MFSFGVWIGIDNSQAKEIARRMAMQNLLNGYPNIHYSSFKFVDKKGVQTMCKLEVVESNLINTALNKPKYLSAPGHYNTLKYLDYLVNKEEKDLNGVDYRVLLNTNLLAGTFNETVYYLPLAIAYLCRDKDDRLEFIEEFIDYIFINKIKIESLLNIKIYDILDFIIDCNTQDFVSFSNVFKFSDKEYGKQKTPNFKNLWFVQECFESINMFETGKKWIEGKIEIMKSGNELQRIWLYTLYEECNEIFGQYLDDETMIELLDSLPETD